MNLTDLHYVVEIDKSGSISKAAKELYVAQPNLSKAIKHLEREFGISIFERSSKGVKATREGQKFLEYAKRIIYEIEEMKRDCSDLGKENLSFKITVPRASYISSAFAEFIGMQSKETAIKAEFQESSSMHAIENVLQNGYSMGIIRYLCENEPYFQSLLDLKGLDAELLAELPYVILTSADGDLAKRELKTREELEDGVEILHGDWKLPTGEYTELSENGESLHPHNKIYIFERGSQFDILRADIVNGLDAGPPRLQIQSEHLTHGIVVGDIEIHALRLVNMSLAKARGAHRPALVDQMRRLIVPPCIHRKLRGNAGQHAALFFL